MRNFLNPPYVFLRDYLGVADPNATICEFARHAFNYAMITHIVSLIVFAVGYCVFAEKIPKIPVPQGSTASVLVNIAARVLAADFRPYAAALDTLSASIWCDFGR